MVLINFFYEKKEKLPFNKGRVRLWLKDVIKEEDKELGCVNFIYCSDEYLLDLNRSYLKHNTLTDVITFNFSENKKTIEGDVYISIERVQENSKTFSETFKSNFFAHPSGISRTPITGVIEEIIFFEKGSPFLIKTTFF